MADQNTHGQRAGPGSEHPDVPRLRQRGRGRADAEPKVNGRTLAIVGGVGPGGRVIVRDPRPLTPSTDVHGPRRHGSSSTPTAPSATPRASSTAPWSLPRSGSAWPPSSATARPSTSTTRRPARSASSPPPARCRSPAIPPSASPGGCTPKATPSTVPASPAGEVPVTRSGGLVAVRPTPAWGSTFDWRRAPHPRRGPRRRPRRLLRRPHLPLGLAVSNPKASSAPEPSPPPWASPKTRPPAPPPPNSPPAWTAPSTSSKAAGSQLLHHLAPPTHATVGGGSLGQLSGPHARLYLVALSSF